LGHLRVSVESEIGGRVDLTERLLAELGLNFAIEIVLSLIRLKDGHLNVPHWSLLLTHLLDSLPLGLGCVCLVKVRYLDAKVLIIVFGAEHTGYQRAPLRETKRLHHHY
jgi:hypothetical protein